jgi:dipeptidyl aminopeptidase/acylaminoacyl peptidase
MKTAGFEADKDRLILYNLKNKTQQDLTETFDQSVSDLQWSGDSKKIFFISGYQATYQIYSIDVASKKIKQITQGAHDYTSYKIIDKTLVATKMTISLPTEIFKVDIKTGKETQLSFTNKSILDKIELGKVEGRCITTTDNKKMLVWVIYPPFFDKTKKYPALLYCQGGPQNASRFCRYRKRPAFSKIRSKPTCNDVENQKYLSTNQ